MTLLNGYKMTTTFWEDFSIADVFGKDAIEDTAKRAFAEWKYDPVYLAELVVVLNLKCWAHYNNGDTELSNLYSDYYYKYNDWAYEHLTGSSLDTYFNIAD